MLITNCLAYEDIKVKLSPVNDSFNLSIDANKVEISLTLNYLQLKTLGDSLISMTNALTLVSYIMPSVKISWGILKYITNKS